MKYYLLLPLIALWFCTAHAQVPGSIDQSFAPFEVKSLSGVADRMVFAICVQPDQRILIGGSFITYKNQKQNRLARLFPDGNIDPDFEVNQGPNGSVLAIAMQPDGKILIGGLFTSYDNEPARFLTRLNPDGSLDDDFITGTGPNEQIRTIALQEDGKILIGGNFTSFDGHPINRIARLNPDGSRDTTFNPGSGANIFVKEIVVQPDQNILVGGDFTLFNGLLQNRITRLLPNGSRDTSFQTGQGANSLVYAVSLQPDGKILLGGHFKLFDNNFGRWLIRLLPNGRQDTSFRYFGGNTGTVYDIALQENGNVLICGDIGTFRMLSPNGSTLGGGGGGIPFVVCLTTQKDGKILLAGGLSGNSPVSGNAIARLLPDGAIDKGFNKDGTAGIVRCLRKDTSQTVLVGGDFQYANGEFFPSLVRIHENGRPVNGFSSPFLEGSQVNALEVRPDGKILTGGLLQTSRGRSPMVRLHSNGSIDTTFSFKPSDFPWEIYSIGLQSQGKMLFGGKLQLAVNPLPGVFQYFGRLNPDGSMDTATFFNPAPNAEVQSVYVLPDDKILIAGDFTELDNKEVRFLARLHPDGRPDTSFHVNQLNGPVLHVSVQADGKLLVGGSLTTVGGQTRRRFARLLPDGLLDTSFHTGTGFEGNQGGFYRVYDADQQPDGKLVLAGDFLTFDGVSRRGLVRLQPNGTLDTTFQIGLGSFLTVRTVAVLGGNRILAGGDFQSFNGHPSRYLVKLVADSSVTLRPQGIPNVLSGSVFQNQNSNCFPESNETPLRNRIIAVEPGPIFSSTRRNGSFVLNVDTGHFSIRQVLNQFAFLKESQVCPAGGAGYQPVFTTTFGDTAKNLHFANQVPPCAFPEISIIATQKRPCRQGRTILRISNNGAVATQETPVYLRLPPTLSILASSVPFQYQPSDSVLVFRIKSLRPNQTRSITITDSLACSGELSGTPVCLKAWLPKPINCLSGPVGWDGSDLDMKGNCDNGTLYFTLYNRGGSMNQPREFRFYADSLLAWKQNFQLPAGDSLILSPRLSQPGNPLIRLEADQSPAHPYARLAATHARCGSGGLSQPWFSPADESPLVATDCQVIQDSLLGGNHKQNWPPGLSTEGFIPNRTPIQYTIRFRNTGQEVCNSLVVLDTLDEDFDIRTFEPGPSSHFCRVSVTGAGRPVLRFDFMNIGLPPASQHPEKSQGFVGFRVQPKAGLPLGTQLRNNARLDFDKTIQRSNTTLNTLYQPPLTDGLIDTVYILVPPSIRHEGIENVTSICIPGRFDLPFITKGTFIPGNVFTAELSDSAGSFQNPVALGSIAADSSATVSLFFADTIPLGDSYRIRVVASKPRFAGDPGNLVFPIRKRPEVAVYVQPAIACPGKPRTLTASGATSYQWNPPLSSDSVLYPDSSLTYRVVGTHLVCTDTLDVAIPVFANPVVNLEIYPADTICRGDSVRLSASGSGAFIWLNNVQSGSFFTPAQTASYGVIGISDSGCVDTVQAQVFVRICTPVQKEIRAWKPEVFPNPGTGICTLRASLPFRFRIMSLAGKVVFSENQPNVEHRMDSRLLEAGMYSIEFLGGHWKEILPWVVLK